MPEINITSSFKGFIPASSLLSASGTLMFTVQRSALNGVAHFFEVRDDNFYFRFAFADGHLFAQRNDIACPIEIPNVEPTARIEIAIFWNPSEIAVRCNGVNTVIDTLPTLPPISLIQFARKQRLLPTETYANEEQFRQRVYDCLESVQEKIDAMPSLNPFWDLQRDGNAITSRRPKREIDIHAQITGLLQDQLLMANIELISEATSAVGDLDLMFIAQVENIGLSRICTEVKPAQSTDIVHGLTTQLPLYMSRHHATYGAYCVLWFKGRDFNQPNDASPEELRYRLDQLRLAQNDPRLANTKIIVFDFSRPSSASVA